ncbi:tRNA pseudouridine(38-40) synthase TruA [Corallincola luteus]|uniref:tRNA pseudouridine synthase A n=1 Tax=Corallincola luteus TaxID=1775177 RepID=A0ABY2AGL3_9GAMM|nr:tRNA pseudouridine(38-40) synthase TruA [Corallincola luteus]TCI01633.1 tRNA pseudouridine(38-40) synthase TruA [Corallincola luteus]
MRLALGIEYDGAKYSGWQRQSHALGVQQKLEEAIGSIANEPIELVCAGRTDAGVHATGQVVHFDTSAERDMGAWTLGVNSKLPDDIAVTWGKLVSDDFHARFTAFARRYRYIIFNERLRPGILRRGVSHYHMPLDAAAMHIAAQCLVGEHDFTSFRAVHCQSNSPMRSLSHITVQRRGSYIIVDVKANAFLHHMVRNIVGSLIVVGEGEAPTTWIADVLAAKDRCQAGATAKPNGLYLVDVSYPDEWDLPKTPMGPLFLA